MNRSIHQYIQDITKASKNSNLIFFIGAGISRLSNYPQWGELVDRYYSKLYGGHKKDKYSSDEYLRIPQIFYDVEGDKAYDEVLRDVFSVERETNSIHEKILAMNPVHIITTNYDNLIEKACSKRGQYLNVISSDKDIATATSSRYLLKVHGDFRKGYEGRYVVLKESDYMNYEQNFPLISNLMKTLMSTHTIVFIGYSLSDYNINSLLNWVRQLQEEEYNKPFFIRGDHKPVEEKTAKYYENRGLRIIDTSLLVDSKEDEYLKRYEAFMNMLIDSRDNDLISTDEEVIEYIYQKLSPLFVLKYVRKLDLKHVFEYDYEFGIDGRIISNKSTGFKYLERFFELKQENRDSLNKNLEQKFKKILGFFKLNGIYGMSGDGGNEDPGYIFQIENKAYHNNYEEMEQIVQKESSDLEEEYQKAFYLSYLGKWEEAYNLYSDLLLKSIDEFKPWIHYLSQINRYRLYQSITQQARYLKSMGFLTYGNNFEPFSKDFLERIEIEMKKFRIDDVFESMPYDFQEKYQILKILSDNRFLYDDTVRLFELTNKIRYEINKGTYSFGLTNSHKVQWRLNDNLRFLYDNYLWSVNFNEFTQYTRNSLMLLIEKAQYDINRDEDPSGFFSGWKSSGFYIDYDDFVNITKSFSIKDIKYLESNCELTKFTFQDIEKIEIYLMRIADELLKHFSKGGMNIVFYNQFIPQAKTAFYFAKYIKLSEKNFTKLVKALLFYFPHIAADIGARYLWINSLTRGEYLPKEAIEVIEDFLISQAHKHSDNDFTEETTNGYGSTNFSNLIHYFNKEFVSNRLSTYALSLSEDMSNEVNFIYKLSKILSTEARKHLLNIKKIENINSFIDGVNVGSIEVLSDYQYLINDFMSEKITEIKENQNSGIKAMSQKRFEIQFARWFFLGELTDDKMKDYIGVIDEYDFFVDPETFDYKKFNPSWLINYSDRLLEKISQNKYMRPHVIKTLKEKIKDTNDKKYTNILIKHFI